MKHIKDVLNNPSAWIKIQEQFEQTEEFKNLKPPYDKLYQNHKKGTLNYHNEHFKYKNYPFKLKILGNLYSIFNFYKKTGLIDFGFENIHRMNNFINSYCWAVIDNWDCLINTKFEIVLKFSPYKGVDSKYFYPSSTLGNYGSLLPIWRNNESKNNFGLIDLKGNFILKPVFRMKYYGRYENKSYTFGVILNNQILKIAPKKKGSQEIKIVGI